MAWYKSWRMTSVLSVYKDIKVGEWLSAHHCIFSTYLCRYKGMNNTCYPKRNPTDLTFFLLINKERLRDSLLHKNRNQGWGLWVWQPPTYATLTDKFCTSLSWLLWEHSGLDPLLWHESVRVRQHTLQNRSTENQSMGAWEWLACMLQSLRKLMWCNGEKLHQRRMNLDIVNWCVW